MSVLAQKARALALRRAAVRATLAPSVHNTQPWRLVLGRDALEIHADATRRLLVVDPAGRQMLMSCGCALFNARVFLAAAGYQSEVERYPDPTRPDVLARLSVHDEPAGGGPDVSRIAALDPVVELRRTNRRDFSDDAVPEEMVDELISAAAAEGAQLVPITRPDHRLAVAALSQRAYLLENAEPAYRAELRAWTSDSLCRDDGVLALAVDHGGRGAGGNPPYDDLGLGGAGHLRAAPRSGLKNCLLLLGTAQDHPEAWLRAGEALEHTLLEVARHGYAASPSTQLIEIPSTRAMLRQDLRLSMYPHVLLRVGRAPTTPATRRRRLVDVLVESI